MGYELLRYIPLLEAQPPRPRSTEWAVYYRVPDELVQRVVFVRAADLSDDIAHEAIRRDMASRMTGATL